MPYWSIAVAVLVVALVIASCARMLARCNELDKQVADLKANIRRGLANFGELGLPTCWELLHIDDAATAAQIDAAYEAQAEAARFRAKRNKTRANLQPLRAAHAEARRLSL